MLSLKTEWVIRMGKKWGSPEDGPLVYDSFFKFFASNIFFPWNHSKQHFLLPQLFFSPRTQGWRQVKWLIPILSYPPQFVKISTRHHGLDGVGRRGWAREQLGSWGLHKSQGVRRRGNTGEELTWSLERAIREEAFWLMSRWKRNNQKCMFQLSVCSEPVYAGIWNQLPWGLLKVLVTWCDVLQRTVTTEGIWGVRLQLVNVFNT